MSTDSSVRARLQAAMAGQNQTAPSKESDVYTRDACAICVAGKTRNAVLAQIHRRMALELTEDGTDKLVFSITQSTKYNRLVVFFDNDKLVSFELCAHGNK